MTKLKKDINAFGVFSIASGAMISSGIFILPGLAFSKVGSWLFLSYFIAGFLGLFGILSMIELTTAMPRSGGDYYIINKTFGPLLGTISGFLGWFALALKSSFAIFGISEIVKIYTGINPLISGLILCLLFVVINILGTKEAVSFQIGMVLTLIVLMIVYIFFGIPHLHLEYFDLKKGIDVNNIFMTAGFIFISFGGLLKVANMAEEVNNPRKNLPLGLVCSVSVVTILYVCMIFIMTGTLPGDIFAKSLTPVADSAQLTMGNIGYIIILVASVLAFFTTANAGIMAASRYPMALSLDKLIPSAFGRINRKTGTPILATLFTGILIYLSLLLPLETLVKAASTVILSSYILTNLSVIVFRESKIKNYKPSYKAPFYPFLQILSIVIFIYFIINLGSSAIEVSMIILLAAIAVYILYGRHRAQKVSALVHVMRRVADELLVDETLEDDLREIIIDRDRIEQDDFDILLKKTKILDIASPQDYNSLIKTAAPDIASELNISETEIVEKFEKWYQNGDSAVNNFLAIPHIIIEGTDTIFMYIIRAKDGIKFSDAYPSIKAVFLLCGTRDDRVRHLKTIAAVASLSEQHDFKKKWLVAENTVCLKNFLVLNDRKRYF
jgi:amino acid transporter/mannitol/fructose-specific phosphotransferase system IIA component (Ntr-type)